MNRRGAYAKKDRNIRNVEARHQLLLTGINAPNPLTEALIASLSDQRRFAALSLPGTAIQAIALNTLKSIANEILARHASESSGFLYLEGLRRRLKEKAGERPSVRTVESQRRRRDQALKGRDQALQLAQVSNLQRSHAYVDLFSKVVALMKAATLDDTTRLRLHNLLQDHKDLYASLLSPPPISISDRTLRVIPGGKA
jgi:hypothetical protein